jgi:hypothetical protein
MRCLDPGYDSRRFGTSQVGLHQQRITAYRGLLAAPAGNIKARRRRIASAMPPSWTADTVAGSRLAFMRGQPTWLE